MSETKISGCRFCGQSFSTSDWGNNIVKLTEFEEQLKAEAMP